MIRPREKQANWFRCTVAALSVAVLSGCTVAFDKSGRTFAVGVGAARQTLVRTRSEYQALAASDTEYRAPGLVVSWTSAKKGIALGALTTERTTLIHELPNPDSPDPWKDVSSSQGYVWPLFALASPSVREEARPPIEINQFENYGVQVGSLRSTILLTGGYHSLNMLLGREREAEAAFAVLQREPWLVLIPYEKEYETWSVRN